ncbi:hypothetical protein BDN72DRAFT_512984 [Pluteus cervinus]|uniref:Uncharacterized protein n=1 Tax=Pluteus cervinus TaxID=181527 RepID=A0ACD3BE94_9AGAR|nr:hypothetical protein BDN72DRAFT_512984 [Pluteus cervinus]
MVQYWEPGTQYDYNDVVEYNGARYKIIQPHRSQGDWTPVATPALWGKVPAGAHQEQPQPQSWQQQQPQQQPPPPTQYGSDYKHDHHEQQQQEEKKTSFFGFDVSEDTKHKIGLGGGLALGAAALGGGLFALKKHGEHKEEAKESAWAYQNWIREAEERRSLYNSGQIPGPAAWVLTHGKSIPRNAIVVGQEHSWTLYICRAPFDGGIRTLSSIIASFISCQLSCHLFTEVGKASDAFKKGGVLGYKRHEHHVEDFEVLCGDMRGLKWVSTSGTLNVANLGYTPVDGGRENNGSKLYVAKAFYKDAVHPGKCSELLDGAYIPYGDSEFRVQEYQVLCYNH